MVTGILEQHKRYSCCTQDRKEHSMASLTRFSLSHRRLVVFVWLLVAVVGIASASKVTKAFSDQYTVPGREGYETNTAIARAFGNGGDTPPLVPVITLPSRTRVALRAGRRAASACWPKDCLVD